MFQSRMKKIDYPNGNRHSEYLIELRDVVKIYKTDAGDFPALRGVNLHVRPGEFVAVIGKSGSGKSTLINMLTGIDRSTSGEVYIGDTAVHDLKEREFARWRGLNVGIVFQFFQLLPTLTVAENVMLPMDFVGLYSPRERRERAMHLLELVDIAEHADKLPTAVSGGQQQRAAIARALANDPPIVVADEPTGNLDSRTASQVFDLFEKLVGEGKTIVMVTHDEDQARRVQRTIVIADGEIINEYLAQAMPGLGQDLLLKATRKLESRSYNPGEQIILQDAEPDRFYVVTEGMVEIFLQQPDDHDVFVDKLGPGDYFGEMALMRRSNRTATVRADLSTGVEVVTLDRETFESIMAESDATRSAMVREAERRTETQTRARAQSKNR